MNEDQLKLRHLLERLTINEITREEFDELFALIISGGHEENVKAVLMEDLVNEQLREPIEQERLDTVLRTILSAAPAPEGYEAETPVRRMVFWRRFAAVAAIMLLIGAGVWFVLISTSKTDLATTATMKDISPGSNKAVLTLADNSTIILDSAANGTLAKQGGSIVNKTKDGELKYEVGSRKSEIAYNTLSTPRGGQYQLVLPDGSKVWLNAASSIRYPTAFTGTERKVEITGEAYFEVAPVLLPAKGGHALSGQKMPFLVQQGDMTVQVLGTHFNVNGYDDEAALMTTLLEGAVRVTKGSSVTVLKPGEQAVAGKAGNNISVVTNPDIAEVMAWKNGQFVFNDATIESIMHQVARWYDVEVVYDAKISKHFIANIPRSVPLSQLLKLLELTDQVHFKIQGRKITILQ